MTQQPHQVQRTELLTMPRAISSFVLDVRYSITSSRRVSSFVALATSVLHHSFMCSIINCAVAVLDHHFKYRIISFPPVPSSPIYLSLSFILLCFVLCALFLFAGTLRCIMSNSKRRRKDWPPEKGAARRGMLLKSKIMRSRTPRGSR
jgi:hypothetical protein